MCGLFGMLGPGINKTDIKAMEQLGVVSQLRGMHGTGVVVDGWNRDKYKVVKQPDDFNYTHFMNPELCGTPQHYIVMGHVRHATVGDINTKNTHPFEYKTFVGCHNGTILHPRYNRDQKKTDSEQFFDVLDKKLADGKSMLEALQFLLGDFDDKDAYAITIWDKEDENFWVARNKNRPFYICFNTKRNVMYYASEGGMLQFVLRRCAIEFTTPINVKDGNVLWTQPKRQDIKTGKIWGIEDIPKRKRRKPPKKPTSKAASVPIIDNSQKVTNLLLGSDDPLSTLTRCITCRKVMDYVDRKEGFFMDIGNGEYMCQCKDCNDKGFDFSYPVKTKEEEREEKGTTENIIQLPDLRTVN